MAKDRDKFVLSAPGKGKCPICATKHDVNAGHNERSAYYRATYYHEYRRMPGKDGNEMNWTSIKDRLPTEKDADAQGCVIAYHIYQGTIITGWHQIKKDSRFIPCWAKCPEEPKEAAIYRERWEKELKDQYGRGTEKPQDEKVT